MPLHLSSLEWAIWQHGSHHKHSDCLVTNKKPRRAKGKNILRMDPTRTTLLRNKFMTEVRQRFGRLRRAVKAFMVEHDALGLRQNKINPITHAAPQPGQYKFLTSDKKLDAFNKWFKQQVDEDIIKPVGPSGAFAPSISSGPWTNKYVESAYKKGALNAYLDAKKQDLGTQTDFSRQSQEQFLRESFAAPETASKIALIGTRTWENMKGVTDTMGTQMNQILAQGLIDGSGADEIAADMVDTIDTLTDTRALVIARTEIIHAHAEGQLDSFADLGIEELGVNVEWSTAGDDRVCPECEDMEGKTFTVDEARGLIPLHPNCRCAWTPSESKK